LLGTLGYSNVRHYAGGLSDWTSSGGSLERAERAPQTAPAARPGPDSAKGADVSTMLIDMVGRRTISQLLKIWFWMILAFGLVYWLSSFAGVALRADGVPENHDFGGLLDSIYFSFVTALSIGYGDVVPSGPMRIMAIIEGAAGLLIFGCVVSKLVSRRQDELLEQTHRIAFEERLGRVRTNLHLAMSEIRSIAEHCADPAMPPERIQTRVESATTVFEGELRSIHDLLYRPQELPNEQVLESILANVAAGLRELNDLIACIAEIRSESSALRASLRDIGRLSGEICGDCVPRDYAPELKDWMDRIQEQSRRMV